MADSRALARRADPPAPSRSVRPPGLWSSERSGSSEPAGLFGRLLLRSHLEETKQLGEASSYQLSLAPGARSGRGCFLDRLQQTNRTARRQPEGQVAASLEGEPATGNHD